MMHKGLSQYQAVQKRSLEAQNGLALDTIMERANLYNIPFLQNKALLQSIIEAPGKSLDVEKIEVVEELLSWLWQTQEEAKLS